MRLPLAAGFLAVAAVFLADASALAQLAHHPFAVGASEGAAGHQNALGAWILAQESRFYLGLTGAVRATKAGPGAALGLIALSFAYGVFHAAGPGHGKAVITSYMVSNEVALRRGLVIALLAAILQGLVATTIVGAAACLFDATAPTMTAAAEATQLASYLGVIALGLLLVWRKGRALWSMVGRGRTAPALIFASAGPSMAFGGGIALRESGRFSADDGVPAQRHEPDCDCGHTHMPDPDLFGARRFDWKAASIAVLAAGGRPCSGAILVLVFALSQGIFVAGVAATFAMSLGTAITTGALAIMAVLAKDLALKISGSGTGSARVIGRLVEFAAAACVLLFGIALLAASLTGAHSGA